MTGPDKSRAVLIGVGTYRNLEPLPAVHANLRDLQATLNRRMGLDAAEIFVFADESDAVRVIGGLRSVAEDVGSDGTLFVYYCGHGLPGREADGGLVLGLPDVETRRPEETGLSYRRLRDAIEDSGVTRCIIVLDCDYAGLASRPPWRVRSSLLVAVGSGEAAAPRAGERHTPFTAALLEVMTEGVEGRGATLTVADVASALVVKLAAEGHPRPEMTGPLPSMDFLANAAYDGSEPSRAEPLINQARQHAGFIADGTTGEDRLGIDRDVETLCDIALAEEVRPPLSIGLFGEWGTGKSFFMARMQARIDSLAAMTARARSEGRPSAYCANVCQIPFNAWHYLDANLWASLAGTIMDTLAGELGDDAAERAFADLPSAREERRDLEQRRLAATRQLTETTRDLAREEPIGLRDVLTAEPVIAAGDAALSQALSDAGVPPGLDLRLVTDEAYGRFRLLLRRGTWATRALLVAMMVFAVAGPAAASVLASLHHGYLAAIAFVAPPIAALVGIGRLVRRAKPALDRAEAVVRGIDQRRTAPARERRELLARQIKGYEDEIRDLGVHIELLERAGSLRSYAADRSAGDDYRRHEGLVALVRRDLEELSDRLSRSSDIERIVLYIDDLDRCPPDRVVEVLQAVNLLLAFPLFVVVVGVDGRWLTRSLERHYRELLGDGSDDTQWWSTPQSYLEKIFQLSLNLSGLSSTSYSNLVIGTLLPEVEADPADEVVTEPTDPDVGEGPIAAGGAPAEVERTTPAADWPAPVLVRRLELAEPLAFKAFTDGDRHVVAITRGGELLRWDTHRRDDPEHRRQLWEKPVRAAAVAPDGRLFVVGAEDCAMFAASGKAIAETKHGIRPDKPIRAGFRGNAPWIATDDRWLTFTDGVLSGSETPALPYSTRVAAADPSGTLFAVQDPDEGALRLWQVNDGKPAPLPDTGTLDGVFDGVAISATGVLAATRPSELLLADVTGARGTARFDLPAGTGDPVLSSDGRRLLCGAGEDGLALYAIAAPDTPPLSATTLRVTRRERQALIDVGPLIATPRSAKRLINTFRLLRAGLSAEDAARLNDRDLPTVCLMLAMQVGFPAETATFLERIAYAPDETNIVDALQVVPDHLAALVGRVLDATAADPAFATWRHWTPIVARFSFRSRPLVTL